MTDTVAVTFNLRAPERAVLADAIGTAGRLVYLTDLDDAGRIAALQHATAILARDTGKDLRPDEPQQIQSARLIQFITAGIDFVPLNALPASHSGRQQRRRLCRTDGGAWPGDGAGRGKAPADRACRTCPG